MGHSVFKNARLYLAEYELGGHLNVAALDYSAEVQDKTCIADAARKRLGGLKDVALQMEGFYEAGAQKPDTGIFGNVGAIDIPVTLLPPDCDDEGDRAFLFRANLAEYSLGGQVGVVAPFSAGAQASKGPLVRGVIGHLNTRTANGNGGAQQLGALSATQRLYAALHVLEVSGTTPSLTVKIQSDNASNFPSATDRITFAAKTAVGSEWSSVAGAVTDDYWRVNFAITGTNPSFRFLVALGIATARG